MPVAVGDIVQTTLVGSLFGQTIMNTFHYGMETVTGAPTQLAVANEILTKYAVAGGFYDKFLGCCPDNYTLEQVWVQFVLDTRYRKRVSIQGLPGTFAGSAATANTAAVISRFGAAANRRNQGSVHIACGSDTTWMNLGVLTVPFINALGQFEPYLFSPLTLATLGTLQPVLIHGTSKLNAIPLIGATTQDTSRVMRRRTVRLGI